MNLTKSIGFLLDKAGPVIRYRLRKEILRDLSPSEEGELLDRIYETKYFKLVEGYAKPSGYIGTGAHSWDNWRGAVLHETPLQDGETAARLLSNYAIPKGHPLIRGFVAAMRDEETLRSEFSYIPPEIARFEERRRGLNSGYCLMSVIYAMQAILGYGDDEYARPFQGVSLEAFKNLLSIKSMSDIVKARKGGGRYSYPYIEEDEFFPGRYHIEALAHTNAWRTAENVKLMADSINHYGEIMPDGYSYHIKIGGKYIVPAPLNMGNRPIRPFNADAIDIITYRRLLTEIAMLGVGGKVGVIRESIASVEEALDGDGILRMNFGARHNRRYSPKALEYPTAYADVRLEEDYKREYALECDLTFWSVQFLTLVKGSNSWE